jgi:hypothetical protein
MINVPRSNSGILYMPSTSKAKIDKGDHEVSDDSGGRFVQGKFSEGDVFFIPKHDDSHLFICETTTDNNNYYKGAFTVNPDRFLGAYADPNTSHVVNPEPVFRHHIKGQDKPIISSNGGLIQDFGSYHSYTGEDGNAYPTIMIDHYRDVRSDTVVDLTKLTECKKFYEVVPNQSKYFKDCLTTAEDLICNDYPEKMPNYVRSHLRNNSNLETGDRDDKNWAIANQYNNGIDADPDIGQAFFTVYDGKKNTLTSKTGEMDLCSTWPYHAAAVVGKDKNDRITLEVFAGSSDATVRKTDLYSFGMWKVGHPEDSFHGDLVDKAKDRIIKKISDTLCYGLKDKDTTFYAALKKLIPRDALRYQLVDTLAECAYENKDFLHTDKKVEQLVNQNQKFIQAVVTAVHDKLRLPIGTVVIEGKK